MSTIYIYRQPENPEHDKELVEVSDITSRFADDIVVRTEDLVARIDEEQVQKLGITPSMNVPSHYLILDVCGLKDSKLVYAIREENEKDKICILEKLGYILDEISSSNRRVEKVRDGYALMQYEAEHPGEKIPESTLTLEDKMLLKQARLTLNSALALLKTVQIDSV